MLKALRKTLGITVVELAALMLAAGRADWVRGWVFVAAATLCVLVNVLVVMRTHPDLLTERSQMQAGTKGWDKVLAPVVALLGPLVICVVAGLDVRYGWSDPAGAAGLLVWQVAGLAAVLAGGAFTTWAMAANNFFAATVRIQTDRGHAVVTGGPYGLVRHPGYLGAIIYYAGAPLALGSWWAFLPAGLTIALVCLRTALEDRTLQAELPGYAEYATVVRQRLVPGLW